MRKSGEVGLPPSLRKPRIPRHLQKTVTHISDLDPPLTSDRLTGGFRVSLSSSDSLSKSLVPPTEQQDSNTGLDSR